MQNVPNVILYRNFLPSIKFTLIRFTSSSFMNAAYEYVLYTVSQCEQRIQIYKLFTYSSKLLTEEYIRDSLKNRYDSRKGNVNNWCCYQLKSTSSDKKRCVPTDPSFHFLIIKFMISEQYRLWVNVPSYDFRNIKFRLLSWNHTLNFRSSWKITTDILWFSKVEVIVPCIKKCQTNDRYG